MAWNDLLGFLIVLFIFLFPLLRHLIADRHKKQEAAPAEEENLEEEEEPPPVFVPPTHRTVEPEFEFHSRLETKRKKKRKHHAKNPLSLALKGKSPLQAMMLASEILGKRDES